MIGVDHLRLESLYRVSGLFRRHRIGKIHAHESHVDVFQVPHLGNALGIPGKVESLPTDGEDITIAAPLVMKELARRRAPLHVVHRDRLDLDSMYYGRLAVRQHLGLRNGLRHRCRSHDSRVDLANRRNRLRVHVVAVNVGNQDHVRLRQRRVIRAAPGIQIPGPTFYLEQHRAVQHRRDLHIAG